MTTTAHIDYEFNVGDKVITTFGEVGEIVSICDCESCKIRGFYEPCWRDSFGEEHYITIWDAKSDFSDYYQIGEYKFNMLFNKGFISREIVDCRKRLAEFTERLRVIEELEKVELAEIAKLVKGQGADEEGD